MSEQKIQQFIATDGYVAICVGDGVLDENDRPALVPENMNRIMVAGVGLVGGKWVACVMADDGVLITLLDYAGAGDNIVNVHHLDEEPDDEDDE